jgi:hypothetical protein
MTILSPHKRQNMVCHTILFPHIKAEYGILYNSNITSFFRFVNKRASYPFGIISLAHVPVNVTDFSIGSINCNPNNADRGRSIIRIT